MRQNLLQSGTILRLEGQTPANQRLASWWEKQKRKDVKNWTTYLGGGHVTLNPSQEETPVEKNLMLTFWHPPGETGAGSVNLHVVLKGNVAADHVKEQNPQRPDGEGDGLVALRCDPLRGAVDPSS